MMERKNLIIQAPVFSMSGYGAHARDIVMGLFNSGNYNISIIPTGWGGSSTYQPAKDVDDALVFMCNNRISDGSEFAWVQMGVPHEFKRVSKNVNIGITAGLEVEQYPAKWAQYCNQMSALIVPSTFVKDRLIGCGVSMPVYVVPEGVDTKVFNDTELFKVEKLLEEPETNVVVPTPSFGFPTSFNFLTVGQWLPGQVGEDRKNIPLAIHAVLDTFPNNPEVGIVVKTYLHNNSSPDQYALIERMTEVLGAKAKGRVHFVHGTLTEQELAELYHHPQIKAFVSLTHGEGYFRPLAEAAACNLPIIVTGWSGHMDFINKDLVNIVEYQMGQVPPAMWMPELLGQGQTWAYPDFEKAKNRIRRCYDGYKIAKQRAEDLGNDIRKNWSLERASVILNEAMQNILTVTNTNIGTVGRIMV